MDKWAKQMLAVNAFHCSLWPFLSFLNTLNTNCIHQVLYSKHMFDLKDILKNKINFLPIDPILKSEVTGNTHIILFWPCKVSTDHSKQVDSVK
jgi:hypothetical protein